MGNKKASQEQRGKNVDSHDFIMNRKTMKNNEFEIPCIFLLLKTHWSVQKLRPSF